MAKESLDEKLDYCRRSGNPWAKYSVLTDEELVEVGEHEFAEPRKTPRVGFAIETAHNALKDLWVRSGKPENILEFIRSSPRRIAEEVLGVKVVEQPDFEWARRQEGVEHEIAGYADRDANIIGIVNTHSEECRRFTLAHELAHLMLHPAGVKFRDPPMTAVDVLTAMRSPEEREANIFAAELLMPQNRVESEFNSLFTRKVDLVTDAQFIIDAGRMSGVIGVNLASFDALDVNSKASIVAQISVVKGIHYEPMAVRFRVSSMAMGIRLKELGLVLVDGRPAN